MCGLVVLSSLCVVFQRSDDTQVAQGCVDPSHVLSHDGEFSVHTLWSVQCPLSVVSSVSTLCGQFNVHFLWSALITLSHHVSSELL